jgi:hypothetical protein
MRRLRHENGTSDYVRSGSGAGAAGEAGQAEEASVDPPGLLRATSFLTVFSRRTRLSDAFLKRTVNAALSCRTRLPHQL